LPAYAKEPGEQELVVAQWVPFIVMIEAVLIIIFIGDYQRRMRISPSLLLSLSMPMRT